MLVQMPPRLPERSSASSRGSSRSFPISISISRSSCSALETNRAAELT